MNQENLIISLIQHGWFHWENFLPLQLVDELKNELNENILRPSKIGKKEISDLSIRKDFIFWLDNDAKSEIQDRYLKKMDELMSILNRELFLGLKQFEGHFARYDKNGFYKKHLDQFQNNNQRLISVISYLNSPKSGGELRIYSKKNKDIIDAEIIPKAGNMICFLSNDIYHEVLATNDERLSIAGWLRTNQL
jgi:SM-20-related protein